MTPLQPTERELEALKVLWEHGEATVRQIFDEMNEAGEELAYTTVLSLLQVMEQKGLVAHRREGKAYVYLPQIEKESTLRQLASGFLDRVFDGALDEYLVHALGARKVSKGELEQLEEMIAAARNTEARKTATRSKGEDQQ